MTHKTLISSDNPWEMINALVDQSQFGCKGFSHGSDGSKERCKMFEYITPQRSRPKSLTSSQSN